MVPKKILLIDDDYDFLESFELLLIHEGHYTYTVTNGYDAVTKYTQLKPDIVFLDMKMPGIDGHETFLRIKNLDTDARIVFTSSYVLDDAKYQIALAKNLAGLINKPMELPAIRKMIQKHAK